MLSVEKGHNLKIFISGVSSGIGRELVKHLLDAGHEVWGIARRLDKLEELSSETGGGAFVYDCCDLADTLACSSLHKKMIAQQYVPDVVILNAALDLEDAAPGLDHEQSMHMMRTNVEGAHFWLAAFIEPFLQRGSGQFIAVGSIFSHWPDPASVSYSASKAALAMLMRGLRLRYSGGPLQFKLVYLGPVDTQINQRFAEGSESNSMLVALATDAAQFIVGAIERSRDNYYFPFYVRLVFTYLRWLPDRLFGTLTAPFKR